MDSWLRPVFTRRGTPSALPPTPEMEQAASFTEENTDGDDDGLRMRSPSRTSLLSFSGHIDSPRRRGFFGSFSSATNLMMDNPPPTSSIEEFPLYKPDQVWVQPSADHMVESLKVVMMKQGAMEPVPVQFNSSILHVLEAYHDLSLEIARKGREIAALNEKIELDESEFERTANVWVLKEKDYKAEIKRLEVIISKGRGGMESVSLARSGSVVHGSSKVSDIVKSRMTTIKGRSRPASGDGEQEEIPSSSKEPIQNKSRVISGRTLSKRYDPDAHMSVALENLGCRIPHGRKEPNQQELKKQVAESYHEMQRRDIEGRISNPLPRILKEEIIMGASTAPRLRSLTHSSDGSDGSDAGMIMGGRKLRKPDVSTPGPQDGKDKHTTLDRLLGPKTTPIIKPSNSTASPVPSPPSAKTSANSSSLEAPHQMSFSFKPGDDNDILAVELERDRLQREAASLFKLSDPPKGRNPVQATGAQPSMSAPKARPHISQSLHTYHGMTREDSNNSIRTVIRDSSSHSSRNSSPINGRPQVRSTSSSEAVTAATRALASSAKPRLRLSSDNRSIEEDGGLSRSDIVIRKKPAEAERRSGRGSQDA